MLCRFILIEFFSSLLFNLEVIIIESVLNKVLNLKKGSYYLIKNNQLTDIELYGSGPTQYDC